MDQRAVRVNNTEEQLYEEVFQALNMSITFSDNPAEAQKAAHGRLKVIDDLIGRGYHGLSRLHQEIQQEKLEESEVQAFNCKENPGKPCVSCGSMVFQNCESSLHNGNHLDIFKNGDKKILEHFQKKTAFLPDFFELKEKQTSFAKNQLRNVNTMWESEDSESENDEQLVPKIFRTDKISRFNYDLSPRWQLIEAEDRNEMYKTKVNSLTQYITNSTKKPKTKTGDFFVN